MIKIAVTGVESSGKSTLSEDLAIRLGGKWIPEYAREYLLSLDRPYQESDIPIIGKGQIAQEEQAALLHPPFLISDTEMLVCKIWMEFKYGCCDQWIEDTFAQRHYDLFLLCDLLPWSPDPLRENPDETERRLLLKLYTDALDKYHKPYILVSGTPEERVATAAKLIQEKYKALF